jgi:hypothetical protein
MQRTRISSRPQPLPGSKTRGVHPAVPQNAMLKHGNMPMRLPSP